MALWRVVWGYKFLIMLIAGLAAGIAVVLALTATPIYRAETVVIAARERGVSDAASLTSRLGGLASLAGINLAAGGGEAMNAMAILESRRLIEEFIRSKKVLDAMYLGQDAVPSLWRAVERFQRTVLSIRTDDQRGTTTIAVNWTDPEVAARWANEFVALANELIRTRDLEDSTRNIEYLKDQIEQTSVVELRRVLYNLIEAETQTVMLANGRREYAFTVVDPAVAPETRERPRRTLMVLTGGAIGLALGVLTAFLLNAVAWSRWRDAKEASADLLVER